MHAFARFRGVPAGPDVSAARLDPYQSGSPSPRVLSAPAWINLRRLNPLRAENSAQVLCERVACDRARRCRREECIRGALGEEVGQGKPPGNVCEWKPFVVARAEEVPGHPGGLFSQQNRLPSVRNRTFDFHLEASGPSVRLEPAGGKPPVCRPSVPRPDSAVRRRGVCGSFVFIAWRFRATGVRPQKERPGPGGQPGDGHRHRCKNLPGDVWESCPRRGRKRSTFPAATARARRR